MAGEAAHDECSGDFGSESVLVALTRIGLHPAVTENGTCVVDIPPLPGDSTRVRFMIAAEGGRRRTLVIRGVASQQFPPDGWPLLLAAINAWHLSHRWPRGYVQYVSEAESSFGILVAEHQQLFTPWVDEALLDETMRTAIGASVEFLTRLSNAMTAPPPIKLDASTLESWLED
jgi:hypothetical protein